MNSKVISMGIPFSTYSSNSVKNESTQIGRFCFTPLTVWLAAATVRQHWLIATSGKLRSAAADHHRWRPTLVVCRRPPLSAASSGRPTLAGRCQLTSTNYHRWPTNFGRSLSTTTVGGQLWLAAANHHCQCPTLTGHHHRPTNLGAFQLYFSKHQESILNRLNFFYATFLFHTIK